MLQVLTSMLRGRPPVEDDPAAPVAEGPPETAFPAMRPLVPPPAGNDDIMATLRIEVERDLRRAGYLR